MEVEALAVNSTALVLVASELRPLTVLPQEIYFDQIRTVRHKDVVRLTYSEDLWTERGPAHLRDISSQCPDPPPHLDQGLRECNTGQLEGRGGNPLKKGN